MLPSSVRLQRLISDRVIKLDGTALAVADDSRFLLRSVRLSSTRISADLDNDTAGRFSPARSGFLTQFLDCRRVGAVLVVALGQGAGVEV
jgi:hypothetical protein